MKADPDPAILSSTARHALVVVAWVLVVVAYVLHFHLDVRHRDCFSWMDPYQYYLFAKAVAAGSASFDQSAVPSIFPFLVLPFVRAVASVPGALWTNVAFLPVLAFGVHAVGRRMGMRTPSVVLVACILASPLLLGLSRTLYVEFALTALVALAFAALLRWLDTAKSADLGLFAALFAFGLMVKMTFPVFFAVPLLGVGWCCLRAGRIGDLLRLGTASLGAVAAVLILQYAAFPASFQYYTSFGNTAIPVMRLIGPPEVLSSASLLYYGRALGLGLLALLTPFLVPALLPGSADSSKARAVPAPRSRVLLWLWLSGPLVLLTFQAVKEPRHVAPCVVPAVLLVFFGLERMRARGPALALTGLVVALAFAQYLFVSSRAWQVPYYLTGAKRQEAIQAAMLANDRDGLTGEASPELDLSAWRFRKNVVIAGFEPNAALALTWSLFPAVVYDLDSIDHAHQNDDIAFESFQDLYILTAFNTYNRRAGWSGSYGTLAEKAILEHAGFVLLGPEAGAEDRARFEGHERVATVATDDGPVRVLRSSTDPTPFRVLYGKRFLRKNPELEAEERNTVGYELLMTTLLHRDFAELGGIFRSFPALAEPGAPRRRIHWISAYTQLEGLATTWMRGHFESAGG